MRIRGQWLDHPGTQQILRMLGGNAYLVGGCVRNDLIGAPVGDIDIATAFPPTRVMDLAWAAGLRVIPTGLKHGTVTVIAGDLPHEVTTFRRDVETDGRHAVVAYSGSMVDDAHRRDFTINALYADAGGAVLDPLGGFADLCARRVRFVGNPAARIAEDHLRILRFFRFHAWYGDPVEGIDADGLAACASAGDGLARLSRERVSAEMLKLLAAPDPAPSVAAMARAGILGAILPGADARTLAVLVHLEIFAPDPMVRLAVLGGQTDGLRLSRDAASCLGILRDAMTDDAPPAVVAHRHGADIARKIVTLRCALGERPLPASLENDIALGAAATFPVKAADLMPGLAGPALGRELQRLRETWIASGFALGRDDLLG